MVLKWIFFIALKSIAPIYIKHDSLEGKGKSVKRTSGKSINEEVLVFLNSSKVLIINFVKWQQRE